ncbi:hypothetical protein FJZ26_02400 [Candidatus Parvarchaeota archaeon]|nr:hypothetical protein [Candidatus Parvarchaeota archaeon]
MDILAFKPALEKAVFAISFPGEYELNPYFVPLKENALKYPFCGVACGILAYLLGNKGHNFTEYTNAVLGHVVLAKPCKDASIIIDPTYL